MEWLKIHSNAKTRKEKQHEVCKWVDMTWVELLNTGKQLKSKREKSLVKQVRIKKDSLCNQSWKCKEDKTWNRERLETSENTLYSYTMVTRQHGTSVIDEKVFSIITTIWIKEKDTGSREI